ncbi:SMAD/FHA domain-containing protein, partial [Protomyces lactucae-debilis]
SVRFVPHVEFSSRLSLNFEPIERRVSDKTCIKIGRYNDKALHKAPISFKSKVVSRQHAEVWCEAGTWYIRDTKSSSGTFLNHIRLSPPGQESKPAVLVDGDCVQFGIDFRGGTEEVYRCVRTRVEINRIFEQVNAKFNRAAEKTLKSLTRGALSSSGPPSSSQSAGMAKPRLSMDDGASTYSSECCICLFNIAPSQALFVAPCSHAYHFKCIRPLILQNYPNFLCCVCRKYADLEANVEVESE